MGGEEKDYGERIGEEIDHAISVLINQAYDLAVISIKTHQSKLVRLAEYLIEYETVSGEAMNRLFNADDEQTGEPASPTTPPDAPPAYNASPASGSHPSPPIPHPYPTLTSSATDGETT